MIITVSNPLFIDIKLLRHRNWRASKKHSARKHSTKNDKIPHQLLTHGNNTEQTKRCTSVRNNFLSLAAFGIWLTIANLSRCVERSRSTMHRDDPHGSRFLSVLAPRNLGYSRSSRPLFVVKTQQNAKQRRGANRKIVQDKKGDDGKRHQVLVLRASTCVEYL